MVETFNPPKPNKIITMQITAKEAHLLKVLRSINFGKIIVQKLNGQLVRVEPSVSIILSEQEGLTLESATVI